MKYVSTRGGINPVSFEVAVSTGYACDGGLYVPETVPKVSASELKSWASLSYAELAMKVLAPFVGDEIEEGELRDLLQSCFAGFTEPREAVKIRQLKEKVCVAELFHGPTMCFKDLGLPFLVRCMAHFGAKRGQRKTLLVSTTGDTGPATLAAVESVRSDYLRAFCCYPDRMISEFQRKQMTTIDAPGRVLVARFEGGGDDMDAPIKRLGLDPIVGPRLCGVNSYNIARPLAQMVHYFWIAVRLQQPFDLVIPTGAMGNLVAAALAKKRGVPIVITAVACNVNDFSFRALHTGDCRKSVAMLKTLSDAINIQVPYNFERLLHLNGCDAKTAFSAIYSDVCYHLPPAELAKLKAERYIAARVDDEQMLAALRHFASPEFVPDPHTAVALAAASQLKMLDRASLTHPVVIVATAHPCKFEDAVSAALGTDAWAELKRTFPPAVEAILDASETPPINLSKISPDEPLADAQARWESLVGAELRRPSWCEPICRTPVV